MVRRREFIQNLSAAAATGILGLGTLQGCSRKKSTVVLDSPTFDLHCHPGFFITKGTDRYPGDEAVVKTVDEMNTGGLSGTFISLVADMPLIKITDKGVVYEGGYQKGEAWAEYKRQLTILKELMHFVDARFVTTTSQLTDDTTGKVAAFFACEGGDFIEGLDLLDEAYEDGIRSVQLVHYVPNHLGDLQTAESMHNGLSEMGKEVVRSMNKLGMVIDVAHASEKTVKDVVGLTDSPIILSHSILKMESDRPIGDRAISKEHAKLVAETGGVIGAWPSGFNTSFDEFVDNTVRLVDVVGINHVGLGTDMDANYKPVMDSYSQFSKWTNALRANGLSDEEVQKLAGGNALRVLSEVLK